MKRNEFYLVSLILFVLLLDIKLTHAYSINLTQISLDNYVHTELSFDYRDILAQDTQQSFTENVSLCTFASFDDQMGETYTFGITKEVGQGFSSKDIWAFIYSTPSPPYDWHMLANASGSSHTFGSYLLNISSDYGNTGTVELFITPYVSGGILFSDVYPFTLGSEPIGPFFFPSGRTLNLNEDYLLNVGLAESSILDWEIYASISFDTPVEPIPEPTTFVLFISGLTGLAVLRKRFPKP